jgi:hypothetical protein
LSLRPVVVAHGPGHLLVVHLLRSDTRQWELIANRTQGGGTLIQWEARRVYSQPMGSKKMYS